MWEEEAAVSLEQALLAGGSLKVAHRGQAGQQNWSSSYEVSGAVSTGCHHSAPVDYDGHGRRHWCHRHEDRKDASMSRVCLAY